MQDPICGMEVKKATSIHLNHKNKNYYFCSRNCLNKFIKKNDIDINSNCECGSQNKSLYRNKLFIVSTVLSLVFILSYLIPFLVPLRLSFIDYFKKLWWALLLGISLGGIIDYYIPREYVSAILSGSKKRTILYAVIAGFSMSVCSHGILAIAMQLYKKGASTSAVISFLLASPWANITLTIMLLSFFGLKALYIIVSAIVIAIITGFIFRYLESKGMVEKNPLSLEVSEGFSIKNDLTMRLKKYKFKFKEDLRGVILGMISISNMVLWWVLIGMGLASITGAYIPAEIFHNYLGPSFVGLILTLLLAIIIEVCSEGSAPMAFEIFKRTGAFGNSFVFLMAGVATDYTEIGLIWHNIGKRSAIWLPLITLPQIILLGIIGNIIF